MPDLSRVFGHPQTVASVFTQLTRTNFRVDTVVEPEPPDDASSAYHNEISRWVPSTLIVRARSGGT